MNTITPERRLRCGFDTERLCLRPAGPRSLESFTGLYTSPEVMAIRKFGVLTRDGAAAEHARVVEHWRIHRFGMYTVAVRDSGEFIGECGLRWLEDGSEVELSYGYHPGWWRLGLATEAARETLAVGLAGLGRSRIIAFSRGDNRASHRVLEKAGMRLEERIDRGEYGVVRYVIERRSAQPDP